MHLNFITQLLKENPWLLGAFSLMGFGGILASLQSVPKTILEFVKRKIFVRLVVTDKYNSTYYLERAFATKKEFVKKLKTIDCDILPKEKNEHSINNFPGFGLHFIWYKNHLIWISRERTETKGGWKNYTENWYFTALGFDARILIDYVTSLCDDYLNYKDTCLYLCEGENWSRISTLKNNKISSLVLHNEANYIYEDMKNFLQRKEWYKDKNIPYHRGYLLHGKPGTGKSSLIKALACELKLDVYYLNLNTKGLDDNTLQKALSRVAPNSIILFEDIDCLFRERKTETVSVEKIDDKNAPPIKQNTESEVTLSGLLNALDGFFAPEGTFVFMTTNHKEKLDEALIRPGRVDYDVYFGLPTEEQIKNLFLKFYIGQEKLAQEFYDKVLDSSEEMTMAKLQGHFLMCIDAPEKAINSLQKNSVLVLS